MSSKAKSASRSAFSLDDIYQAPGHLIRRAQQIAVGAFFEEFKGHEVTPVQYAALVAIRERPGIDQRTLVNLIAIDRSTIGSMLRVMEDRMLISRVTPRHNQRIKQLFILPLGNSLVEDTRQNIERVADRILEPLTPSEREMFMRCLVRLVDLNNGMSRVPLQIDA